MLTNNINSYYRMPKITVRNVHFAAKRLKKSPGNIVAGVLDKHLKAYVVEQETNPFLALNPTQETIIRCTLEGRKLNYIADKLQCSAPYCSIQRKRLLSFLLGSSCRGKTEEMSALRALARKCNFTWQE